MLSAEILRSKTGELDQIVEIYFDRDGLSELIARLQQLQQGSDPGGYLLLGSGTWGFGDLAETSIMKNSMIVHQLRLGLIE